MIWALVFLLLVLAALLAVAMYGPLTRADGVWVDTGDARHACAPPRWPRLNADNRIWVCDVCRQAWRYSPTAGWYKA
jgi:hypothetical protein